jgi:hypothetical protein
MTHRPLAACLLSLAVAATQAATGPSQGTAPLPGGFVTACASQISSGVTYTPGRELQSAFDFWAGQATCNSQVFNGLGSGSATADWTSPKVQNHSSVQASLGAIHLATSNVAPKNIQFPVAVAGGGWNDTITFTDGQAGQTGRWLFQMAVDGSFTTAGGASAVELAAYKNKVLLGRGIAGFDRGDSDALVTDAQQVLWRSGNASSRSVSDLITFAVPFVYGQAFSFGVYATAKSGLGSYSGSDLRVVDAAVDFSHTLRFAGTLGVVVDGVLDTNPTLVSASGVDWRVSTVPEPATWCAMLAGLGCLGLRARRAATVRA